MKKSQNKFSIDVTMAVVFFVSLIAVMIIAFIPALRPEYSESEKRELTKFPKFSISALISGDFFDDINLWYADTFPFRDSLIKLNNSLKVGLSVNNSVEIHGDVTVGDDIPTVNKNEDADSSQQSSSSESLQENSASEEDVSSLTQEVTDNTSSNQETTESETVETEPQTQPTTTIETLGAAVRVGDAAYEYYNFVQKTADEFSSHISYAADVLSGKATVYSVIVPTSIAVTLPDDMAASITSSNQQQAIEYMFGIMSSNVVRVNPYETLRSHKDEYIYFRTDHHWTSLGAYYAYCDLMMAKGVTPPELSAFKKLEFAGYLGSFYNMTKSDYLKNNPDTVEAYEPVWTNTITTFLDVNTVVDKNIVSDGNALKTGSKYLCFVSGDRPYGVINNPALSDGSSCLLVKESFGNAMVSFFVANYQTVHVIDYRHFASVDSRKLSQFVTDNGIQDVVFVNNISATRNSALVNMIGNFVRE